MDLVKKEKKKRKQEKWMDNWRERINLMNIPVKTASEVAEAYKFSDSVINNLARSYPEKNVCFDGCKLEEAKLLLTGVTLWYLYAYPLGDGLRLKFALPSVAALASFMELFVQTEQEYDFENAKDKSYVVPKPFCEVLAEIAAFPLLQDKGDKSTVHSLYSDTHEDVIEALPDVHPYIYKTLMAFALQNKKQVAKIVRICVTALRKANYVVIVPKELL